MAGDEKHSGEFEAFYRADHLRLLRLLMHFGAGVDDAWDAAQETYALACLHWGEIERNPAGWTRRTALREYRRLSSRSREELRRAQLDRRLLSPHLDELDLPEEVKRVNEAIARLPRREAEVMALTIDGFKPREIAKLLSDIRPDLRPVTANSVSSALRQARQKLRQELAIAQGGAA